MKRNAYVVARYHNIINLLKLRFNNSITRLKILDLGCGDGVLSYLLWKCGAEVFGIDYSFEALRYANNKIKNQSIKFINGSAYSLPWGDEYFDAVISSDVIEHLQDAEVFLSEAKRVVKTGGSVIISTPIRITGKFQDRLHVVEWFHEEFIEINKRIFSDLTFYKSHPLFWLEIYRFSAKLRMLINILSLVKNPFQNFKSKLTYKSLQYVIAVKSK
jgi:2-polyprenyl-3-methyl-5-hydroxy-6-metoxy-1,4-benzoquinol methylase